MSLQYITVLTKIVITSVNSCGYYAGNYPENLKIVLIVHPDNFAIRKEFGLRHGFKVAQAHIIWAVLLVKTNPNMIV